LGPAQPAGCRAIEQFTLLSTNFKTRHGKKLSYFGELAGACDAAGEAAAAGDAAGAVEAAGDAAGTGVGSGAVDCKTEREPVTPGSDRVNAISMKAAAAPMVTFDNILAVPRGPKAVLETLLEKRSPAPDLPG
jgi:hypothetical protein